MLKVLYRKCRKRKRVGFKFINMLVVITMIGSMILACGSTDVQEAKEEARQAAKET